MTQPRYRMVTARVMTRVGGRPVPEDAEAVFVGAARPNSATLVGPRARIVRHPDMVAFGTTFVSWPIELPEEALTMDADALNGALQNLGNDIRTGLNETGEHYEWVVAITPYSDTVNGPLDWWRTGEASNTATRQVFVPSILDYFVQTDENPVGPNSNVGHRTDLSLPDGSLGRGLAGIEKAAVTVLWVGLGGVALWGLSKIVMGTSFHEPPPPPHQLGPGAFQPVQSPPPRQTYAQRHARSLPGLQRGYK